MKSRKIALFLIVSALCASASVSAFWRDLASDAAQKISGALDFAHDAGSSAIHHAKDMYGKYNDFIETPLGKKVHAYAKKYGAKAAEKAFELGKGYLSNKGYF